MKISLSTNEFVIHVTGRMAYPEDDPVYGTYERTETLALCHCTTIDGAVEQLKQFYNENTWPIRDEDHDYYDPELGHDCGPVSFCPWFARVADRAGNTVVGGEFNKGIVWYRPIVDPLEVEEIKRQQKQLNEQGGLESGWDNFSTARSLWRKADQLALHLIHMDYLTHPDVVKLTAQKAV